jgi:hypothetical protein
MYPYHIKVVQFRLVLLNYPIDKGNFGIPEVPSYKTDYFILFPLDFHVSLFLSQLIK